MHQRTDRDQITLVAMLERMGEGRKKKSGVLWRRRMGINCGFMPQFFIVLTGIKLKHLWQPTYQSNKNDKNDAALALR
ncbi:hypothetical protein HI914_06240 [Erysiphe necator]|nr:hypothetical protein HI914_06240 [Erysiphe necator]